MKMLILRNPNRLLRQFRKKQSHKELLILFSFYNLQRNIWAGCKLTSFIIALEKSQLTNVAL